MTPISIIVLKTNPKNHVFFASTGIINGTEILPKYGKRIIQNLLDSFKEYDIIFRPTPSDREHHIVSEIINCFSRDKRFSIDLNKDIKHTYAQASLLVCDSTNSKNTFALSTLRPYIEIDVKNNEEKVINSFLGFKVFNIEQLNDTINIVNKDLNQFESSISKYRDSVLNNANASLDYLFENLNYIIENKTNKDWLYIDKQKFSKNIIESPSDYLKYINYFAFTSINYIKWSEKICKLALIKFQNDPSLLAVYAKILFIQEKDQMARQYREKAYYIDKNIASK